MRVEEKLIQKPKTSSKKSRRRQQQRKSGSMPRVIQRLYEACKEVFSGAGVPSPAGVARIRSILDSLSLADVGLSQSQPCFRKFETGGLPAVTYLHVYECPRFSIGIFCLPPSAVIPLHNHPEMTVFGKLLFGSMHIKSYDWVDVPQSSNGAQPPGMRLAKMDTNAIFNAPCETCILYPASGGNMHRFTAVTSCAVLDVLAPPYSEPEGRPCTYYNDFPYESFSGNTNIAPGEGEKYAWLEERAKPDDFFVLGAPYTGPEIVEL